MKPRLKNSKRGRRPQLKPFKHLREDTQFRDFKHNEKLQAKLLKVQTLQDLLRMHEGANDPDISYVIGLRRRVRIAQQQLKAMRP